MTLTTLLPGTAVPGSAAPARAIGAATIGLLAPRRAATVPSLEPGYDHPGLTGHWPTDELPLGAPEARSSAAVRDSPSAPTDHVAKRVLTAVSEVLAQRRPLQHLASWATDDVLAAIARLDRMPTAVRSVRVTEPVRGVAEVSAVLTRGPRVVAVAARFEHHGRWRCTAFHVL